jgi:hypothetical protein
MIKRVQGFRHRLRLVAAIRPIKKCAGEVKSFLPPENYYLAMVCPKDSGGRVSGKLIQTEGFPVSRIPKKEK